jgi:hypothetical protein
MLRFLKASVTKFQERYFEILISALTIEEELEDTIRDATST